MSFAGSRELLQDSSDAQIIGVVAVGALRGGVAEPRGQAASLSSLVACSRRSSKS